MARDPRHEQPKYERRESWEDEHGRWESYETENDYNHSRGRKLRRNKIDGVIAGVCSGLGDFFGIDHTMIRIIIVIRLFMTAGNILWVYLGFWIFVPSDKRAPYRREYREARKARKIQKSKAYNKGPYDAPSPTATFKDVKSKYRSLETRLQDLERSITSKEWKLRQDFRDLER